MAILLLGIAYDTSDAVTGGAQIFGNPVNPISTGVSRLSLPIATGTLKVFHLTASLNSFESF